MPTRAPYQLSPAALSELPAGGDDAASWATGSSTPSPTRTPQEDWRVALHEAAHLVCGQLVGRSGSVTIEPGDAYGGLTWWTDETMPSFHFESDDAEVSHCFDVRSIMPPPGNVRASIVEPVVALLHEEIVIDLAGKAGEALFFTYGPPLEPASDLRKARARAGQICSSEASIDAMVAWALEEAKALLLRHRGAVLAVAEELVKKRTLTDPVEIAELIATGEARQSLAEDQAARKAMRRVAENAAATAAIFQRTR